MRKTNQNEKQKSKSHQKIYVCPQKDVKLKTKQIRKKKEMSKSSYEKNDKI